MAQEVLHTTKKKNLRAAILRLDLLKAYDRVSWVYLRLALLQVRLTVNMVNRIIGCFQNASFVVLINGSPSYFYVPLEGFGKAAAYFPYFSYL